MCTSFTYQTKNGSNALARTMDFSFVLDPEAVMIPRNYSWKSQVDETRRSAKYALAGLGRKEGEYIFADGVNEKGLSCAVLYFAGYATYEKVPKDGAVNLAPHEVVLWMLSSFASVEEVRDAVKSLTIVDSAIDLLGIVPPFHWIVTDAAGATIVIEPMFDGLAIHDNQVGVMANAPDFPWHMTNIRNYIGISPVQLSSLTLAGMKFAPFGQGSGTVGLPGDYTSPSRFLRVLFGKETAVHATSELDSLTTIMHILSSVDVPKGSVIAEGGYDYTQHTCAMFCETRSYYFKTYDNSQICKIDLMHEDLNASEPKVWIFPKSQQVNVINAGQ